MGEGEINEAGSWRGCVLRQNDFIDLSGLERVARDVRRDIVFTFILPSGAGWGVVCVTTKYHIFVVLDGDRW